MLIFAEENSCHVGESTLGIYGGKGFYDSYWASDLEQCKERCSDDWRCHHVSHAAFGVGNLCMLYQYYDFMPTSGATSRSWDKICPAGNKELNHIDFRHSNFSIV